ncbi:Galactosylceramide sulfotransferase-like 3 [Homarus americanus]|uniref:Galactosylceramide sulfotransferase-like 3 n=1 Tax=Homarus americanus TaxID=6706 RepID=A0A8J5MYH2_HOMAM|nr:Galactosylceramide sulfotransferase-like 3 [Homarus americanus]
MKDEPRMWSAQRAIPTCRPRRHLVFLKTHKCGSSTIQNVLMRYADANNLSVALPYSGQYLDDVAVGQSIKVRELKASPFAPPTGKYHFLIHHTRLNVRAIQQLTYDDSVWVTIVREPSAVFESMFHYYHLHKFYGATFDHLVYMGRLGRNQITWDMGLDDLDMRQESLLKEAINILDQTFHLVLVAERMDESLVLLRHLMCWTEEDVVAMARNVRKDRYRSYLSEHSVNTLEHFNAADVKLFDKHVEAFGRGRMEEEVTSLREMRDKVWKECGLKETNSVSKRRAHKDMERYLVVQYKVHNNGSTRQQKYCTDLVRSSIEYTQKLRWKQYSRFHFNINNPWNLTWSLPSPKRKSRIKSRRSSVSKGRRYQQRAWRLAHHHPPKEKEVVKEDNQKHFKNKE